MVVFIVIESRVEHPLLPFRVFMNRTRASSFVAMFFAPAAMFAMFYFLSQYIQNVMGYSPLKAGVAFLPFTVGIVFGAGLASNLVAGSTRATSPGWAPCSRRAPCTASRR